MNIMVYVIFFNGKGRSGNKRYIFWTDFTPKLEFMVKRNKYYKYFGQHAIRMKLMYYGKH